MKTQRGFTLLESMVAITVLLVAVSGPLSSIGGSLSQIYIARDQMIALNLAQEGIETVRQKRDSNMLAGWNGGAATWSDGLTSGAYTIDSETLALQSCTTGCTTNALSSRAGVYQDASGYHQYSGTTPGGTTQTKYFRVVNIEDVPGSAEKKITASVVWKLSNGATKSVDVSEYIFGVNTP